MKFSTGIILGLVLVGAESVLAADTNNGRVCRGRNCGTSKSKGRSSTKSSSKVIATTTAGVVGATTIPISGISSEISSSVASGSAPVATSIVGGDDGGLPISTGTDVPTSTGADIPVGTGNGADAPLETGNGAGNGGADNGGNNGNGNGNGNGAGNSAGALALNPANIQSNSAKTGQEENDDPAQAESLTDPANFINFCTGKTLTNGLQVKSGSCNGIAMGDIPSTTNMISSLITFPGLGEDIAVDTEFDILVKVLNLVAGSFTNAAQSYYSAPQTLQGGKIVGHTHVTVQKIESLNPTTLPDPAVFEFFKGINDPGDGNGNLKATVPGLPAGFYRVCTMTSASNHQPVLMPVAQRGAQDDCQKFSVGQGGNSQSILSTSASSSSSQSSSISESSSASSGSTTDGFGNVSAASEISSSNQNSSQSSNKNSKSTSTVTTVN